MREIVVSDEFLGGFDSLSADLQQHAMRRIRYLAENPAHPSLNVHKLKRTRGNFWECYITDAHRLIYEPYGDEIRLWKIGDHTVVDRVHLFSFSPHTAFRRLDEPEPVQPTVIPFEIPVEWLQPQPDRPPDNPFAYLPASHLRILGVPRHLVKAVQSAPYIDNLSSLPELPEHTLNWLLELVTNPQLEDVLFDSGRLIFRTTLDRLEGYVEGQIQRLMLNLSDEQQRYVTLDQPGVALMRGCAGSGKTTVAIYRAIRHAEEGHRVILLNFSKTLASVSRALIEELIGPLPDHLYVTHLDAWQMHFLRQRHHTPQMIDSETQRQFLQQAITAIKRQSQSYVVNFPWFFFLDEINRVIKGQGLQTEAEYLAIPRYGRQTALRSQARSTVWAIYQVYQSLLKQRGLMDWSDLTLLTYRELLKQPLTEPFDHVIVDETQDMTVMQLRVAQRLNKGGDPNPNRSVFLVGDVAQTIYSRGFTWKQAGLQVQGKSYNLRRNFRNTRQIAEAAAVLNANNRQLKFSEGFIDPEFTQRQGPWPIVLECDLTAREQRAVCEKLLDLVEGQQFRLADFAILCPTLDLCHTFQQALRQVQIPCMIHTDEDFDVLQEQVKILTIHSAKGLEFPVLFLTGLHNGILPRSLGRIGNDEEANFELERNRTLMYVGMTRAAEALYLVTSQEKPSQFIAEINAVVRYEPFTGGKA